MVNGRPHPLLAQIPLTVSPFISLPTATTLPYTYKPLPSTLPPSSTADSSGTEREDYIVSRSGHAASPSEIIASCQALQRHIDEVQHGAEQTVKDWEQELKNQELAEKRRVAPGWLDREEKILEPKRTSISSTLTLPDGDVQQRDILGRQNEEALPPDRKSAMSMTAGDELDRAFGGIGL